MLSLELLYSETISYAFDKKIFLRLFYVYSVASVMWFGLFYFLLRRRNNLFHYSWFWRPATSV